MYSIIYNLESELVVDDSLATDCLNAARELTKSYPSHIPPFCPSRFAEEFGVAGIRERLLTCDARLAEDSSGLFIEVNSIYLEVRRRLSLAHEIGHLILNRCTGGTHLREEGHNKDIEVLCNRIAGLLLAPDWAIRAHFENLSALGDWPQKVRCATLLSAASAFNISVEAMAARVLRELGLAPSVIAVIWRYSENKVSSNSSADLRVSSVWQSRDSSCFVPLNKTAPQSGVIRRAWKRKCIYFAEEQLVLGSLRGKFHVDAAGFGAARPSGADALSSAVLSLLCPAPQT
jgi:Zn-dependent peptidase ImmA (M78 family)